MVAKRIELESPRKALSLFQHHDGITGTAKNSVVEDYAKRFHEAIAFTQQWMIHMYAYSQLLWDLLQVSDENEIRPCWLAVEPREWKQNMCETSSVALYNPLDTVQYCGSVAVAGHQFAKASLPCEKPGPVDVFKTKFIFDPVTGLMKEPIQEEWKLWKVQKGGAYLFFPDQQDAYDLLSHDHKIEAGGFVVSTTFWKRTVVEREIMSEYGEGTVTAIDFIYETDLRDGNQEWFTRFSSSTIANQGFFYTDLNGFDFDTHRFRSDMPIQSQVFPMPTLASIQD